MNFIKWGVRTIGGSKTNCIVTFIKDMKIILFVFTFDNNHRIPVPQQDIIDKQTGNPPVPVLKRMDADVAEVQQGS
ncbi:hypothetical protein Barb6XT_02882 [Bacteroidales bacterium Barb6XT]|nr:hypothetical protein Barb6XT_02882 [Bacteroidales bacterium Barb6XT]